MNDASTEETHIDMSCESTLLQFEKRQLQNKMFHSNSEQQKIVPITEVPLRLNAK